MIRVRQASFVGGNQPASNSLEGGMEARGNNFHSDWALVASILWELENTPGFKARTELIDARRLYDAGDIDAASNSLRPILAETVE